MKPAKHKHAQPPSLEEALNFDEEALELNRDGQLSNHQRDELMAVANSLKGIEVLVYLGAVIVGLVVIVDGILKSDTITSRIVMLGVVGALAYGLDYILRRHITRYQQDTMTGIEAIQGHVVLDFQSQSNSAKFLVTLSGETFSVSKNVFLAFKTGDPYVVYFAPRTRRILSAELLRQTEIQFE